MTRPSIPGRARQLLAWLPAVVLVPTMVAGAIYVSLPEDAGAALRELQPLDLGTTWVYAVSDHGRASGTRTRQIGAQSGLGDELLDSVTQTSRYTDFPGLGEISDLVYLGLDDEAILQYGLYVNHDYLPVEPPAPAYQLPLVEGHTWSYDGQVGTVALAYEVSLEEMGDVEVSGRTFTSCAHFVTEATYTSENTTDPATPETTDEWTCPGYGAVRVEVVNEGQDVERTEELVEFHGTAGSWFAGVPPAHQTVAIPGQAPGFDVSRSHATQGQIQPRLAWSDSPSVDFAYPSVANNDVTVLAEEDGEVWARDISTGEVLWRVRLAGPVVVAPTIAANMVLVADARKRLWALGLDDGTASWVHTFDDMVSSSPAVSDVSAFVTTEDARVTALNLTDGDASWQRSLTDATRAAPAIYEDRLILAEPGGRVRALDPITGEEIWSQTLDGPLAGGPTIADHHVLAVDDSGILYSYDLSDGGLQWESRSDFHPAGDLAAANGAVVSLGDDRLEAFSLDDGNILWSTPAPPTLVSPAIVGDQTVSVSETGTVEVRALSDGVLADSWQLPLPGPGATMTADVPIGLVGGAVVFGAEIDAEAHESTLFAYPVSTEAERDGVAFDTSVRAIPSSPNAASAMLGSTLFVPGQDKTLYRSTGQNDVAPVLTSTGLQPGVTVSDELVIAQQDYEIQALPIDGGDPVWRFPASEPYPGSVPTVGGDTVFVPEYGVGLAAVSLSDGTPRWFQPIDNAIGTVPPLPLPDGDVVYGSGSLARYDGRTGQVEWSMQDTQLFSNAAYDGGLIFADAIRNEHPSGLVALDAASGERIWSHHNQFSQVVVGPVAADGVVVYTDAEGLITAFDTTDGAELWTIRLSTPTAGVPVITDGMVMLSETGREEDIYQRENRVSVHDLHTGEFLGGFQAPGQGYLRTPAVAGTGGILLLPATNRLGSIMMLLEPRHE